MSSAPLVLLAPTSPAAPLFWPGRGRQQITQADHAPRSQCHQYTWMNSKYTPKNCTHKTMMPLFPTLPGDKHLFLSLLCPTHSSLLFSMPLHFFSSVPLLLLLHAPTLPLLHALPSLSITPLSFFSSLPLPLHHTPLLLLLIAPPSPSHPSPSSPHCPFLSITPLPFFSVPLSFSATLTANASLVDGETGATLGPREADLPLTLHLQLMSGGHSQRGHVTDRGTDVAWNGTRWVKMGVGTEM